MLREFAVFAFGIALFRFHNPHATLHKQYQVVRIMYTLLRYSLSNTKRMPQAARRFAAFFHIAVLRSGSGASREVGAVATHTLRPQQHHDNLVPRYGNRCSKSPCKSLHMITHRFDFREDLLKNDNTKKIRRLNFWLKLPTVIP